MGSFVLRMGAFVCHTIPAQPGATECADPADLRALGYAVLAVAGLCVLVGARLSRAGA
jgi:hypothetical protein